MLDKGSKEKQEEEFSQMSKYQIVDALIEREQLKIRIKVLEERLNNKKIKDLNETVRIGTSE